jgi:hypothetical protein
VQKKKNNENSEKICKQVKSNIKTNESKSMRYKEKEQI